MRLPNILLMLVLAGCAKDKGPHEDKSPSQQLIDKYRFYLSQVVGDAYGFVGDHCDSLLFTSLAAYAGVNVDVYKAEKSPGEWQRHPAFDCFPDGGSDSTISKDMFVGLEVYLAGKKDADAARRILDYGSRHNYFMGTAKDNATLLSKTLLSVGLISDFKRLAGMGLVEQHSDDSIGVKNGYLGHLDILRVYSSGLLYGGISNSDLVLAKAYCDHSPRNALYCAVSHRFDDGVYDKALSVLLDETLFPSDRLPGSDARCEPYLWQREDEPKDWGPCPDEGKTHQGIDFLIAARVMLGAVPQ